MRCFLSVPIVFLVLVSLTMARLSAEPFRNLNFEDSETPGLAGWTPYYGLSIFPCRHEFSAWKSGIQALDSIDLGYSKEGWTHIEGQYSMLLQGGTDCSSFGMEYGDASISQVGDVPVNAKSIRIQLLRSGRVEQYSFWRISLAGNDVLMIPLKKTGQTGRDEIWEYGGNVSSYAGSTSELVISTTDNHHGAHLICLDAITFSSIPVPEPSTLFLFASGLAGLAFCQRRFRRGRNS
jgi:hypothetical protein